jgi:5-methylcytosine-specific restriction endonuclease McrA
MTKRTKALNATPKVRELVYERDSYDGYPYCPICGKPGRHDIAHYIAKSQSGLAVPKNLINLCRECHELFDHGRPEERRVKKAKIATYLQSIYPNWNESELKYRKD